MLQLALQALQLEAHPLAQLRVEVGQRLVEQQQRRLHDQRAREREALLLAAGELRRLAVGQLVELPRPSSTRITLLADFVFASSCRSPTCSGKATFSNTVMCGQIA